MWRRRGGNASALLVGNIYQAKLYHRTSILDVVLSHITFFNLCASLTIFITSHHIPYLTLARSLWLCSNDRDDLRY